jgi:hypothetical protein
LLGVTAIVGVTAPTTVVVDVLASEPVLPLLLLEHAATISNAPIVNATRRMCIVLPVRNDEGSHLGINSSIEAMGFDT